MSARIVDGSAQAIVRANAHNPRYVKYTPGNLATRSRGRFLLTPLVMGYAFAGWVALTWGSLRTWRRWWLRREGPELAPGQFRLTRRRVNS